MDRAPPAGPLRSPGVEIIDHRLIGAVHLVAFDRDRARVDHDDLSAFQTATIESLLDGRYVGDLTIGELLGHGDLGIGTIDHLDGELVVIDGAAFVVSSTGAIRPVGDSESTPFAVVCRFGPSPPIEVDAAADFATLTAAIDEVQPDHGIVTAVRVDGHFPSARVRSVPRQDEPFPPLSEVVSHQTEWHLGEVTGSLVGFRFPDPTEGLEVAGWHLHLISDDRTVGGHVIEVSLAHGTLRTEALRELHVELPASVGLPALGDDDERHETIRVVEGR